MLGDEQRKLPSEEPIGIVISRGAVLDPPPRLRAYVWAAVKDVETVPAADTR
jgi:hypothetical protein